MVWLAPVVLKTPEPRYVPSVWRISMSGLAAAVRVVRASTASTASLSATDAAVTSTCLVESPATRSSGLTSTRSSYISPALSSSVVHPLPVTAAVMSLPPTIASKYVTAQPPAPADPVMRYASGEFPSFCTWRPYTAAADTDTLCSLVWS